MEILTRLEAQALYPEIALPDVEYFAAFKPSEVEMEFENLRTNAEHLGYLAPIAGDGMLALFRPFEDKEAEVK